MGELKSMPCPHCHGTGLRLDPIETGRRMRELRKSRNIRMAGIARVLGYSPSYLSDVERGRRPWTLGLVEKYEWAMDEAGPGNKVRVR